MNEEFEKLNDGVKGTNNPPLLNERNTPSTTRGFNQVRNEEPSFTPREIYIIPDQRRTSLWAQAFLLQWYDAKRAISTDRHGSIPPPPKCEHAELGKV